MALKFLDNRGFGSITDAIEAVNYATMMRGLYDSSGGTLGANIVLTNNSWNGGGFSQAMFDAIQASGEANTLFVASAGFVVASSIISNPGNALLGSGLIGLGVPAYLYWRRTGG